MKQLTCMLAVLLSACATQPEQVWHKAGSSEQQFDMDKGQCNAQAFSIPGGSLMQIAIVQNSCMRGKGWNLVNR